MTYKPGIIYILNAYGSQLTWEPTFLKDYNDYTVKLYYKPSKDEIISIVENGNPDDKILYLIIPKYDNKQLPDISLGDYVRPLSNNAYFILVDNTGLSDKKREKLEEFIKQQDNKYIKSCHLKGQNYLRRKEFKDWYKNQEDEDKEFLQRYTKSPWMLYYLSNKIINYSELYCSSRVDTKDIKPYLNCLGNKASLSIWNNMPSSVAYRLFINKDMNRAGAYLILSGGINHPKNKPTNEVDWMSDTPSLKEYNGEVFPKNGLSSTLWYYYTLFKSLFDTNELKHPYLLYLFALWVYISNSSLRDNKYNSIKRSSKYLNFYPSKSSLDFLDKCHQEMLHFNITKYGTTKL